MKNLLYLAFLGFSLFSCSLAIAQNTVDFSADNTKGCNALAAVNFSDSSTGNITSWQWDFGNNNTSNLQNPTASYSSPGTYTVSLTVSGPNGSLTETKNAYIQVFKGPTANFSISATNGCQPLSVNFEDKSALGDTPINQYIWDFGDGSPENNQNDPVYSYPYSGNYDVSLQLIDTNACSDLKVFSSISVVDRPQPSFTTSNSPNNCTAPHTVHFVNYTSAGTSLDYLWDFGDGNTSTDENPSHTYTNMGTYDVSLIAKNNLCSDTIKLIDYVSIEPISAEIDLEEKYCFGDTIYFNSVTTGASKFNWDFGDGSSSTEKEPFKIFADSGYFEIGLVATSGANCVASDKDSIYIKKLIADILVPEDTFCMIPLTIDLINNSTYGDKYTWYTKSNKLKQVKQVDQTKNNFQRSFASFGSEMYYLFAEDIELGCESVDSQYIFLYDPSPLITTDEITLSGCIPLSKKLDFEYGFNTYDSLSDFKWYINEDKDSSQNKPFEPTFISTGTHRVFLKIENDRGCIAYDSIQIAAGDTIPLPQFTFADTICEGENEYFIANSFLSDVDSIYYRLLYTYPYHQDSIAREYYPQPIPNYYLGRDTGKTYIQYQIIYNGCENISKLDSFFVNGPITRASVHSLCNNNFEYNFNASIIGGFSTFEWDFGDGSAPNTTHLSLNHTFPDNSPYSVRFIAYNKDSTCNDTSLIDLVQSPPPVLHMFGNFLNCVGDSAFFSATVANHFDSLQWFINDSLVLEDKDILTLHRNEIDSFSLKVVAKNLYGCKDVFVSPVIFSKPQADFKLDYTDGCLPFPVEFTNNTIAEHYIIDSVFWHTKPWGLDTGINNQFNLQKNVLNPVVISGELMVKDLMGCTDSIFKDSLLLVKENKLNFWAANKSICLGDSVYFDNFSSIEDPHYQWIFGDGDTATGHEVSHVFNTSGKFDITLNYVNDSLCERSLTIEDYIFVQDKPFADFVADTTHSTCYPLPVTFTDLSADPNIDKWLWDFGDGVTSSFQNPFHSYTSVGKFDVSLIVETTNGCTDTIVKPQYIQTSGPTADIVFQPDSGCIDQKFLFKMENAQNVTNFYWDFGDGSGSMTNPARHTYDTTGKIYPILVLSDTSNDCNFPKRDSIYIFNAYAKFEISTTESCVNSSIQFSNTSIGATQLFWNFGDGNSSQLSNPAHSYSQAGNYTVTLEIIGENGCVDSAKKQILINPLPDLETLSDTFLCSDDTLQLLANGGIEYLWSPTEYLNDPNIPDPLAFPDTTTEFKVKVKNNFGCWDSTFFIIHVVEPPVDNDFKDTNIIVGETIQINSNNPDFKLDWQPQKWLSCYNCANPLAQPLKTTLYTLHTSDIFGCFSMLDSILISVKEAYSVSVPNAFTPNGDGNNDIIYVKGWGIKQLLHFKIYNRWGELLFETSNINEGWDGFYKNKVQDVETYVYTVEALMYNNETFTKKGNISLIR